MQGVDLRKNANSFREKGYVTLAAANATNDNVPRTLGGDATIDEIVKKSISLLGGRVRIEMQCNKVRSRL
jgi:hypothetical protein